MIAAGSVVDNLESIRARLDEDPTLAHTPDFIGPWSVRWREYREPPTLAEALPRVAVPIADQEVEIGESFTLDLAPHFTEPNGRVLAFVAEVAGNRASLVLGGAANLTVTGRRAGVETITVRGDLPHRRNARGILPGHGPGRRTDGWPRSVHRVQPGICPDRADEPSIAGGPLPGCRLLRGGQR